MAAIKALMPGAGWYVEQGERTTRTSSDCVGGGSENTQTEACLQYYAAICSQVPSCVGFSLRMDGNCYFTSVECTTGGSWASLYQNFRLV